MNTPHETVDSIERSAYDSAMIEEAKEKWEIDFDKLFSEYVITYGRPNGDLFMSENATPEGIKDFIRTQRSLAQQEIREWLEQSSVWDNDYVYLRKALLLQKFDERFLPDLKDKNI